VADHRAQPVRLDHVVGVDHSEQLNVLRQPARRLVEGAGLEARPVLEVDELEARTQPLALRLQGAPQLAVRGVVVDHLHDEIRVVELGQGRERLAHDLQRLVVGRHLDRNLR
jgi:hypothetical protein